MAQDPNWSDIKKARAIIAVSSMQKAAKRVIIQK